MTIFLDLAGSLVVRASMVTVMLGLTMTMNNALYETTQRSNTITTLAVVDTVIYADLYNAVPLDAARNFTTAKSQKMVFLAKTSGGLNQPVTYDATETYTRTEWDPDKKENVVVPLHRLYRNGVLISSNLLDVCFTYFNTYGRLTTLPDSVNGVRVRLVAKVEGVNKGITTVQNDSRTFPRNLN
jgi:hypothetical protein